MEVRNLFLSAGFVLFLCGAIDCRRIAMKNRILEDDAAAAMMNSDDDVNEFDLNNELSTGPEKIPIDVFDVDKSDVAAAEVDVDEEMIREAEKNADKDLLNGLNAILKKNETLEDIFKAENVYEYA